MIARDQDAIDCELALLVAVRTAVTALGGKPTCAAADELLDERGALTTNSAPTPGGVGAGPSGERWGDLSEGNASSTPLVEAVRSM